MAQQTLHDIKKLYKLSLEMADLAEEIFESRGEYSREFLDNLAKSQNDARAGKTRKIDSLADLT